MSSLFSSPKIPAVTAQAAPQVDDATAQINAEDTKARKQGRKSTVLTSSSGLPDLGSVSKTGQ